MGLLDWAKRLKDEVINGAGQLADDVLPGDQSSWHGGAPVQGVQNIVHAVTQPVTQVAQAVESGASRAIHAAQAATAPVQQAAAPLFKIAPFVLNQPQALMSTAAQVSSNIPVLGPVDGTIAHLGAGIGQGLAQTPIRVAASVAQPGADAINRLLHNPTSPITFDPSGNPALAAIFGHDKIGTYQSQADAFSQWAEQHGMSPTTAGLLGVAVAPALAAGDLFTGGKGKAAVDTIAKATTEDAVRSALVKHLGEDAAGKIPDQIVTQLAQEASPNKIRTILKGGSNAADSTLAIGTRVNAGDRGNVGIIVATRDDGSQIVQFTNKKEGTTAQKVFQPGELTPTSKTPPVPTPGDIKNALLNDPSLDNPSNIHVAPTPGAKERGFTDSVQNSDHNIAQIKEGVAGGSYDSINNVDTLKAADDEINKVGLVAALHEAKTSSETDVMIQAKGLRIADYLQSEGQRALEAGDEATADAHFSDAIDVLNKVAERATKNGQDTQILAAYNRLTPEGIVRYALKGINDAKRDNPRRYGNLTLTAEKAQQLRNTAEAIRAMPEGLDKMVATHKMLTEIAKLTPSTNIQKAITLWKAGLLTGIKGQLGNQVGNATRGILDKIADLPASQIDAAIGLATGQRGKTFTLRGIFKGVGEGLVASKNIVRHGFDPQSVVKDKYDVGQTFFSDSPLGKAATAYTNLVFRSVAAGDRPYYYARLHNSLADQAIAAAKTAGRGIGRGQGKFVKDFIANPPEYALVQATSDAQEAIFANDNAIGHALKGLKRGISMAPGGDLIAETNVPFTGVPSSVATAVIDYSPVGAIKGIYNAISAGRKTSFGVSEQRALSTALGRAVTGTGVMWLGYKLMLDGKLTLGYPQDPQTRALWEQEGKQPYSVLIGGKWRSLNYTGPIMALIGIGGQVADSKQNGASTLGALATGALSGGQAAITSTPLSGVQSALDVISDPKQNAKGYINSLAGSVVPTLVKDVSNATDNVKRQVNNPIQSIEARLPRVRKNLDPAIGVDGQPVMQDPSGIGAIVDPFKSTDASTTPLTDELQRLSDTSNGIVQSKQDGNVSLGGQKVKLNDGQLTDYKQQVGTAVSNMWGTIITDPSYQKLSDADKKTALQNAKDAVTTAVNATFATQHTLGDPAKARADANGLAASVLAGTATPEFFTVPSDQQSGQIKLQQLEDSYAADKASGTLDPVQDFNRQKAIASAKANLSAETSSQIKAKFSPIAVELAGLSKKDLSTMVASGQVSQDQINEMVAYKQAVASNKLTSASGQAAAVKKASKGKGTKKAKKVTVKRAAVRKVKGIKLSAVRVPRAKNTSPVKVKTAKAAKITKIAKAKVA